MNPIVPTLAAALLQDSSRSTAGTALFLVGAAFILFGQFKIVVLAFRKGLTWGFNTLLVPGVSVIFVLLHWDIAGSLFLLQLFGFGLLFMSIMLGGGS